ncbi:hypothetical protein EGW08_006863, partial [Elysia chlorotica]
QIESYWTYELCHGKSLKQYHETREQGAVSFKPSEEADSQLPQKDEGLQSTLPVRDVEGVSLPYFEVVMDSGTRCDLTGQPRKSRVLYICQPEGRGEIYEFKESSTCEYEVLVLSALLCKHPKYRPKTQPITEIRCHAMVGSPLRPSELSRVEYEVRHLQSTPQGTGWWKHEVCIGRYAKQFHKDKQVDATIYLGYWDKEKHLKWLQDNPNKRPKAVQERKVVSLFYSDGDVCDLTGKPRTCEVRLKCLQNIKSTHAVILSLSEPSTCQYVLTVESALFCDVLKDADENGLFNVDV